MHCAVCRLIWDVNDEDAAKMCPKQARLQVSPSFNDGDRVTLHARDGTTFERVERTGFISALAPDFIN